MKTFSLESNKVHGRTWNDSKVISCCGMKVSRDKTEEEVLGMLERLRNGGADVKMIEECEGQAPETLLRALDRLLENPDSDTAQSDCVACLVSCLYSNPERMRGLFLSLRDNQSPEKQELLLRLIEIALRSREKVMTECVQSLLQDGDFIECVEVLLQFPHNPIAITILGHLVDIEATVFDLLETALVKSERRPHMVSELIRDLLNDGECFEAGFMLLRTVLSYKSLLPRFLSLLCDVSAQIPLSHVLWQINAFEALDYLCMSKGICEEWSTRAFVAKMFTTIDVNERLLLCGLKFVRNIGRVIRDTLGLHQRTEIYKKVDIAVELGNMSCIRVSCEMICDAMRSSGAEGVLYWFQTGVLQKLNAKKYELNFVAQKRFVECVAQIINYGPRECVQDVCTWRVIRSMLVLLDSEIADTELTEILVQALTMLTHFVQETGTLSQEEVHEIFETPLESSEAIRLAQNLCM